MAAVDVVGEGALVLVPVLAYRAEEGDARVDVSLEKVAAGARLRPEVALAEETHEAGPRLHDRVGERGGSGGGGGGRRP